MADQSPPQVEEKEKRAPKKDTRERGKGIVKNVISGDTLVILNVDSKIQNGPPVTRQITLTGVTAPRLGRAKFGKDKKDIVKDEPFAWPSREFLRKLTIGKQVTFVIEVKTENREYGVVFLNQAAGSFQKNLIEEVVAHGWAKVKRPEGFEGTLPDQIQKLIDLEDSAHTQGKGLWAAKETPREIVYYNDDQSGSIPSLFNRLKNKPLTAIVDSVRTGSSLRILLVDSENSNKYHDLSFYLSGVQCPEVKGSEVEPFGREAKFFTEYHVLGHDVTVIFESADKFNLYGTIDLKGKNLAEQLLSLGLATFVEWSANKTPFAEKLRAAERQAQERAVRIWASFKPKKPLSKEEKKAQPKAKKEIVGVVSSIVNAGIIVVTDNHGNATRVTLSSIRVPRAPAPPKRGEVDKPQDAVERYWAWEGKELVRKKLIGQRVRCVLDYVKPSYTRNDNTEVPETPSYSVYGPDKKNIAVELVTGGWAWPTSHKGTEQRSADYELLLEGERYAQKAQKGVHANKESSPMLRINDLTLPDTDADQSRAFLPFLQRAGKMRGVVEFVFSASRFKIYVPKENCIISVSLAGIKTPRKDEPLGKESVDFSAGLVLQHDVEFEISSRDKFATFVGSIWVFNQGKKQNIATSLLEEGYASIFEPALKDLAYSTEYKIAEESAKRVKKKIWQNYNEEEVLAAKQKKLEENEERRTKTEYLDVTVTEILDATQFYVQIIGNEFSQLESLMQSLASLDKGDAPYTPKNGELVLAQFSEDNTWYRGRVQHIANEFQIFYIDYGNTEYVPASRIRALKPEYQVLPPQAKEASLAFIKAPALDSDYGEDAAEFLKESVANKTMVATVAYRNGNIMYLALGDRDSKFLVNASLVKAGLAKVDRNKDRHHQALIDKLKEEEKAARSAHLCIWEYGDPGSDDESDDRRRK